VTTYDELK
jgi:hypothetical protein